MSAPASASGARVLVARLRPQRRALLAVAGLSALLAAPTAASGYTVARALDGGFLAGRPGTGLAWLAVLALAGAAGAVLTRALYRPLAAVVEPFRDGLVADAVRAGLGRAVEDGTPLAGATATQATEEVETARRTLAALLRGVHGTVSAAAGAVAGLALLAPQAVAVVLPFPLAAVLAYRGTVRTALARQRRRLLADEDLAEQASRVFGGRRDIASCAAEPGAARAMRAGIEASAAAELAVARNRALRALTPGLGIEVPVVLLFALAPWLAASGRLSAGEVAGAAVYLAAGLGPALYFLLQGGGGWVVDLLGVLGRLGEVAPVAAPPGEAELPVPDGSGGRPSIVLRDVRFSYGPDAAPVLDGVSEEIPFGGHVAVVGPSGAGKSTLAALLCGIHRPLSGTVAVGGAEPADGAGRGRRLALVPQEAYVFAGTVRENLAYLAPAADDATLLDAAARFGLDGVLERLGGLDGAVPAGGAGLSAGERQLLALARTYLAPAPIVVLDEATCHLDPVAERRAEEAFARRGGTLVVIAHRLSSALHADRILLVDGGRTVSGSHADLLAASPRYRELAGHWEPDPPA
ncbi:ABC transporter ATP-binding protein [Actinomadura fibrosa]|uniref:ABC transporter ATP-binding protein n=1 Tax=Actinomadura fibrosa TaxID=111802 RepID=A0ABW2XVW4_9ACTN